MPNYNLIRVGAFGGLVGGCSFPNACQYSFSLDFGQEWVVSLHGNLGFIVKDVICTPNIIKRIEKNRVGLWNVIIENNIGAEEVIITGEFELTVQQFFLTGAAGGVLVVPGKAPVEEGQIRVKSTTGAGEGLESEVSALASEGYKVGEFSIVPLIPHEIEIIDSQHHILKWINTTESQLYITVNFIPTTYDLNISTTTGGTVEGPLNCSNVTTSTESCTVIPKINYGTNIDITARAATSYVVDKFIVNPSSIPFTLNTTDSQNHTITITNNNFSTVDVTVIFASVPCALEILIDQESFLNKHGQIKLEIPDKGDNYSYNTRTIEIADTISSPTATIYARPDSGYQVKEFVVTDSVSGEVVVALTDSSIIQPTGSSDVGIQVAIAEFTSKTVAVRFEEFVCQDLKTLNISISGIGSVSPLSGGTFCVGSEVSIQPFPANGWAFSNWTFPSGGNFQLDGNNLQVTMVADVLTGVTANFVEVALPLGAEPLGAEPPSVDSGIEPGVEPPEESSAAKAARVASIVSIKDQTSSMFYCPSENYKDNIVSFSFTNNNEDPSIDNKYHFRINFYNDVEKSKLIYSTFSLADNKRWFLDNEFFSQLSSEGLSVGISETVSIIYDPEILFSQVSEFQKPHLINDKTVVYEKPLICGIKYYVELQAYELSTNSITDIGTIILTLSCNKVDSYYWNYNKDKNNWLCSGQGKTDLKVSGEFGQSINSSIDSNLFGIFKIVWQGRKLFNDTNGDTVRTNNIYSALWESNKDILYSSGQGLYDVLEITDANHPIIISDPALNFYISGITADKIKYKACSLGVCESDDTPGGGDTTNNFEEFCFSGESTLLSSVYDKIKMRVYEKDIAGSLVINDEKVVSVVNKKSIKLDVDGLVGAYAVRARNMEDSDWGEWINIDNELYGGEAGEDKQHNAYRIDNSRFLFDWDIERNNGLRRICCQVLTMYGISNTFCIEMLVNFEITQHVFKFYTNNDRTNEFLTYNGQYVLSLESPGTVQNSDGTVTVYFDAVFSEPIYKDETNSIPYIVGEVKFNVVQQGINDKRNQDFDTITVNKFSGSFVINKNDGIFNKDGVAFIELIFPGASTSEICGSDERDKYNFINADAEEISNIDLLPEEVYQKYQRNQLSKALDINKFKQNYDKDDVNFKFGNPGHYKE